MHIIKSSWLIGNVDQYGDTTVIEKKEGWFHDETTSKCFDKKKSGHFIHLFTVTETDEYGNTTVEEESSWF